MLPLLLLACATKGPTLDSGEAAPDFTLLDAYGEAHSLSDYAGDVIILDLSAFW